MKVILLQDVAKLGRRFAIVDVPDGYGINKLIPKGLAKPATPENVKAVQARATAAVSNQEAVHVSFSNVVAALDGKIVCVTAAANSEGRLFQALKPEPIATALTTASLLPVVPSQILISEPIKMIGKHRVLLTAGADQHEVEVTVVAA
jgi:large subunit ribosomal protein L9